MTHIPLHCRITEGDFTLEVLNEKIDLVAKVIREEIIQLELS